MPLTPGTRLGGYEVVSPLGAGGMGEVYRARDSRLARDVAIKILPDAFISDPERLARFEREAQLLAALNHPHIAAIYGLEEAAATRFLVMELVEGETLAERISKGASGKSQVSGLPISDALAIARQIAEALQAAHEKGIIHRDLKPANIALTADDRVKVLDFGLAKVLEPASAPDVTNSPTLTLAATQPGVILGTAAYMSPEQARGRAADKRSDVWAFGCVLYEMLTGRRVFDPSGDSESAGSAEREGNEVADTLAAVLRGEPDWRALPASTPSSVRALLEGCLEKDRKRRIADISTALFVMNAPSAGEGRAAGPAKGGTAPGARLWRLVVMGAVGLVVGALVAGASVWVATRPESPRVTRLSIAPSSAAPLLVSGTDRDIAISPDGTRVAYVGGSSNQPQLFVRALDQLEPTPLAPGASARGPFFSPDGEWIGFFDGTFALKRVAVTGGPAVSISGADAGAGARGATWGPDGTIVFATNSGSSGLLRISNAGGERTIVTRPNREQGELAHLWPEFLPDGHSVLFTVTTTGGGIDNAQIEALNLNTGARKVLLRGGSHAHYAASGHLVYGVAGTLRAVPFDLGRLETTGTPVPVVPQLLTTGFGAADFDVARNGTIVHVPGGVQAATRTLLWVNRQGREEPLDAPARAYAYPRISPDGTRVAVDVRDQDNDVWIWSLAAKNLLRLTSDPTIDRWPIWTPDGRRVIFSSDRLGPGNLFWQLADGTAAAERLIESQNAQYGTAITRDGKLIFMETAATRDVAMMTLDQPRHVTPLVHTQFTEENGDVSPDGRWLAYEANDTAQLEVYVQSFPDVAGGRFRVSTGGGTRPHWSPTAPELFYMASSGGMMSVPFEPGAAWKAGAAVKLFDDRSYFHNITNYGRTYDVSPDGRRFLMLKQGGGDLSAPAANLVVIQNWFEDLKRLAPAKR